jgi:polyhydroxybutyrate depolymerase
MIPAMKIPLLFGLALSLYGQSITGSITGPVRHPSNSLIASALPQSDSLQTLQFQVEGVDREALVYAPPPARTSPNPLVFVFHGHGGNMHGAAKGFHLQTLWPAAIVVYPQGLNTPGRLTDPEGKRPGWQAAAGAMNDRDLKLFDAILATLRAQYKVDRNRIYATGHSNGGGFTYLLWAHRGAQLAAVAPSGAASQPADRPRLKPKPVLHIAGRHDALVKFEWQQSMIDFLKSNNGPQPVETYIYDGGHAFPKDAPAKIAAFFQAH